MKKVTEYEVIDHGIDSEGNQYVANWRDLHADGVLTESHNVAGPARRAFEPPHVGLWRLV